jgi:hypothetical protein
LTGAAARRGFLVQAILVAATAALAMIPAADGLMLVVTLVPGRPATTIRWLLPTGALLAAPGPYAGSFVVEGSRAILLPAALANGALLLTARFSGCATDTKER